MCTICGCGATPETGELHQTQSAQAHAGRPLHSHQHPHNDGSLHVHTITQHAGTGTGADFGAGPAGFALPGISQQRIIQIERDVLEKNNVHAHANRQRLKKTGTFALNFVSSPGSGKTTLLVKVIGDLKNRWPIAVIEGDQQTSRDAERIRAAGVPAVQINTGKGCHLDAHMTGHALDHLPLERDGLVFIENVGNLVCPAGFDLGEAHKVAVLSMTEGEDKPLKYPGMFAAADVMLLNKSDLLPYLDFDASACMSAARQVNPGIEVFVVSAKTGAGLTAFYRWIETHHPCQKGMHAQAK